MAAKQTSLMKLQDIEGHLVTSSGTRVLEELAAGVSVRQQGAVAILGLHSPGGKAVSSADFSVGKLKAKRFLALGRTSLWWMTPAWGTTAQQIPEETQFLLLELEDGTYGLILPLIDSNTFRATLRPASAGDGRLIARIESGAVTVTANSWHSAVLVGASRDPYELMQMGIAAAARLSGTAKHRSEKEVPAGCDVFGWCTWDAFYSQVSASGIQAGLQSLVAGGAPPKLLIIDDGWQQTDVDVQYREAAAAGCVSGTGGMDTGSAVHEVEEAAAALLSGPDNHMDVNLHAIHKLQREESEEQQQQVGSGEQQQRQEEGKIQPQQQLEQQEQRSQEEQDAAERQQNGAAGPAAAPSAGQQNGAAGPAAAASSLGQPGHGSLPAASGVLGVLAAWVRAARGSLAGAVAHLESAFFNYMRRLLETTPSTHWRMRFFAALAGSRLVREPILRFYASASDHTRRLVCIKANSKFGSPGAGANHAHNSSKGDLRSVVAAVKQQYGLRYVYCWHALGGYWGGLGLPGTGMDKYQPKLVLPTPTPGLLAVDPAVAWVQPVLSGVGMAADPSVLHQDMHQYLASCGVDGVKVDVQSTIGLLGSGLGGGPATAAIYHASLEASARANFPGNHLINCMCHSTEDLYRMEDTNLARVSDDFYPDRPASHTAHIANCAFNTLLMGEIVVPDWDMFHSQHVQGLLHATARAVSGGPVYVSDRPGRHNFQLLRRLVLPDGSVLRCRLPGRPTADCLFTAVSQDGVTPLKVWNANQYCGLCAVFNIQGSSYSRGLRRFNTHDEQPGALTARVAASDVPALAGTSDLFAAYLDSSQEMVLLAAGEGIDITVAGGGGSDVVTLSPVGEAGGVQLAPIGLVGMLNAGGAVVSCSISGGHSDDGYEVQPARAALQLRGAGTILCYASHKPCSVAVAGQEVAFQYDDAKAALRFELAAGPAASAVKQCTIQF